MASQRSRLIVVLLFDGVALLLTLVAVSLEERPETPAWLDFYFNGAAGLCRDYVA